MRSSKKIDFLVADYLAEFTMGILAKQKKASNNRLGYATTFVDREMKLYLKEAVIKRGIKIVVNAGGMNPEGCCEALRKLCKEVLKNL